MRVAPLLNQVVASGQVDDTDGSISGIDHTFIETAATQYQEQVAAYIVGQNPSATLGAIVGTKHIIPARLPMLASTLPYRLVVRGDVLSELPDVLRHQFRFRLYASSRDRVFDIPALEFAEGLPGLAGEKITLSYAPASQADADLIHRFLEAVPADADLLDPSTPDVVLPSYMIELVAELRVNGELVASGGPFSMGQTLVTTMALFDPSFGWHEAENLGIAGEYEAMVVDAGGIPDKQRLALETRMTVTQARLDAQALNELNKEHLFGDMLYLGMLSYFATLDVSSRANVTPQAVLTYRRPSFGRLTVAGKPQYAFGLARAVAFEGLELDIDRLSNIIVSKDHNRDMQRAAVLHRGMRQSALEHVIPELFFMNATSPQEAVSTVKALSVASQSGQKLFTITSENIDVVLPQLTIDADAQASIRQAVAAGRVALTSQHNVDIGGWRGVGYVILDPETGSGSYLISGGLNGGLKALGWVMGVMVALMFLSGVSLATTAVAAVGTIALATVFSYMVLAISSLTLAIVHCTGQKINLLKKMA